MNKPVKETATPEGGEYLHYSSPLALIYEGDFMAKNIGKDVEYYVVSNYKLQAHIRDRTDLTMLEAFTALMLSTRRNAGTLQCNPSYATLARDIKATRQTAITGVKNLVKKGVIKKIYSRSSNYYIFTFDLKETKQLSEYNLNLEFTVDEVEEFN